MAGLLESALRARSARDWPGLGQMRQTRGNGGGETAARETSQEERYVAKVRMPQLGESVAEGTIGKWLKQPGDSVAKDEPLLEVITDKVNAEVPSPFAGVLRKILVEEGQLVPYNAEIAEIEEAAGATPRGAGTAAAQRRLPELRPLPRARPRLLRPPLRQPLRQPLPPRRPKPRRRELRRHSPLSVPLPRLPPLPPLPRSCR